MNLGDVGIIRGGNEKRLAVRMPQEGSLFCRSGRFLCRSGHMGFGCIAFCQIMLYKGFGIKSISAYVAGIFREKKGTVDEYF